MKLPESLYFLRPGWWVVHVVAIAAVFGAGFATSHHCASRCTTDGGAAQGGHGAGPCGQGPCDPANCPRAGQGAAPCASGDCPRAAHGAPPCALGGHGAAPAGDDGDEGHDGHDGHDGDEGHDGHDGDEGHDGDDAAHGPDHASHAGAPHDHTSPEALRPLMQQMLVDAVQLQGALSEGDLARAAAHADAIAGACEDDPAEDHGALPDTLGPSFVEHDRALHGAASQLGEAARADRREDALSLNQQLVTACQTCHAQAPAASAVDLRALTSFATVLAAPAD